MEKRAKQPENISIILIEMQSIILQKKNREEETSKTSIYCIINYNQAVKHK